MIRYFIFLLTFLFLANCGSFHNQTTIQLSEGRTAAVFFSSEKTDTGERIFVVEFTNEGLVTKESQAENDVIEIWDGIKAVAEKEQIDEAVIKYRFRTGELDKEGKQVFEGLLFTADRTESGRWAIRKVE